MNRSSNGGNPSNEEPVRTNRDGSRDREGISGQGWQNIPNLKYKGAHAVAGAFGNGDGSGHKRVENPPRDAGLAARSGHVGNGLSEKTGNQKRERDQHGTSGVILCENSVEDPGKRKKRRRGKRKKNRTTQDQFQTTQLRNMRAPAKPAEDVTFDPDIARKKNRKRNRNSRKPGFETTNNAGSRRQNTRVPYNRGNGNRGSNNLYAALDLGTNNCRLLVAMPQEVGRFRVVDAFSRIVRLGEGLGNTGRLSDAAMERSVEALKICAGKLRNKGIKRFRLIATEACRQAENGEEFLVRVKNEIGLELEIVNRETEARLAAEGCGTLMDKKADGAVLFDIGGGSSELILIDQNKKIQRGSSPPKRRITDGIAAWTSLPLGVVTLAEQFGGREVTQDTFDRMVGEVIEKIERFEERDRLAQFWKSGRVHLLGTSGTVTTIAGVHLNLPKYDRRKVDGVWLRSGDIDNVISRLVEMDYAQRANNPCIGKDRADLVLAGCAILEAIRKTWPCERLRVADRGLREGLLTEMISKDGAWISPKKGRWRRNSRRQQPKNHSNAKPISPEGRTDG